VFVLFSTESGHDGSCTTVDQCSTTNAVCTASKCVCESTHYYDSGNNICTQSK